MVDTDDTRSMTDNGQLTDNAKGMAQAPHRLAKNIDQSELILITNLGGATYLGDTIQEHDEHLHQI